MKKIISYLGLVAGMYVLLLCSCKKKEDKKPAEEYNGTYFSINQFALDEWNTFAGEAFVITKTVRVNQGHTDSSFTNSDTINWAPIIHTFLETDISDPKYLGKYKFTQFDDNADDTHNFFYEADDKDLFTQKVLITIDRFRTETSGYKIKGIYIETLKNTAWAEEIQKLYYNPLKTIQIQKDVKPRIGKAKLTVEQYDFQR